MKKILIFTLFLLLITGCVSKEISNGYKKMKVASDSIDGYTLDLRIEGNPENEVIDGRARISNYNNDYKIVIVNPGPASENTREEIIYVKNSKIFVAENGFYVETNEDLIYTNPNIYLEGLNYIKKNVRSEEIINKINYHVYDVIIDKSFAKNIIEDLNLSNLKIPKDIEGKVYIDGEGYVYRIIYYINDITITATYFWIDADQKISFPSEIK